MASLSVAGIAPARPEPATLWLVIGFDDTAGHDTLDPEPLLPEIGRMVRVLSRDCVTRDLDRNMLTRLCANGHSEPGFALFSLEVFESALVLAQWTALLEAVAEDVRQSNWVVIDGRGRFSCSSVSTHTHDNRDCAERPAQRMAA